MNIPGYGEICDQDGEIIFISFLIFIPACIIFLIRNLMKLSKNKKSKNRKTALLIFFSFIILSFGGLNKLIFLTWFGKLNYQARSITNDMVFINLYNTGKFYSEGYFSSCYEEITGTYRISADTLRLEYEKESDFISKNYILDGRLLINFDEKIDVLSIKIDD